jgi:hypothetical protein
MKKTLLFILVIACFVVGCKLDESGFKQSSGDGSTSISLLGAWFIKSQITLDDPVFANDTVNTFNEKDYYLFNSDNSFKYSSSYPDTVLAGKYAYTAATQKLSFGPDAEDSYTITKLTADSLILSGTISGQAGNGPITVDRIIYKLARK